MAKRCSNPGCNEEYDEKSNKENSCVFHDGKPLFHEGLKGWSCCSKRVTNFDELFTIAGCKTGFHKTEEKNLPNYFVKDTKVGEEKATKTEGEVEVYNTKGDSLISKSTTSISSTPYKIPPFVKKEEKKEEKVEEDDPNVEISVGTQCTRYCCKETFKDENSRKEECVYHKGEPIFHEGSKFWSCCLRPKCAEFEEMMKIVGCTKGKHKFQKKSSNIAKCRHDWYQSHSYVSISVFAKNIAKEKSKIDFHEDKIDVFLHLSDNSTFQKTFHLYHPIKSNECKTDFLSTKVEIKLAKTEPTHWHYLEK